MASTISQIKQQVNQIGQQATSTAGQLNQLASNLDKNVAAHRLRGGGTHRRRRAGPLCGADAPL